VHSWNIFGVWMNYRQTQTHKIHHGPDLGETTTFPLIVFFVLGHKACTQMSFCFGTPKLGISKFLKLGFSQLWRPITSYANLQLRWGLKQIFSPCWDFFNYVCQTTFKKVNQGNFWLLMVGSQIGNLTSNPFFWP